MVSPPLLPALKGPLKERYSKFEVFSVGKFILTNEMINKNLD
jgi:hypothetical protein